MFVIQRHEDRQFVTPSGSRYSYTKLLQEARQFPTRDAAQKECCGNETVLPVSEILPR
jgi:hypothetical protein